MMLKFDLKKYYTAINHKLIRYGKLMSWGKCLYVLKLSKLILIGIFMPSFFHNAAGVEAIKKQWPKIKLQLDAATMADAMPLQAPAPIDAVDFEKALQRFYGQEQQAIPPANGDYRTHLSHYMCSLGGGCDTANKNSLYAVNSINQRHFLDEKKHTHIRVFYFVRNHRIGHCTGVFLTGSIMISAAHCLYEINQNIGVVLKKIHVQPESNKSWIESQSFEYVMHPDYLPRDEEVNRAYNIAVIKWPDKIPSVNAVARISGQDHFFDSHGKNCHDVIQRNGIKNKADCIDNQDLMSPDTFMVYYLSDEKNKIKGNSSGGVLVHGKGGRFLVGIQVQTEYTHLASGSPVKKVDTGLNGYIGSEEIRYFLKRTLLSYGYSYTELPAGF